SREGSADADLRSGARKAGKRRRRDSRWCLHAPCRNTPDRFSPLWPGKNGPPCVSDILDKARTIPWSEKIRISRHDDFVLEAAGRDDQQGRTHQEKNQGVRPEVYPAGAAQDDAASDIDVISGGNKITEVIEKPGHRFAREDVTGEKDAREYCEKRKLHGVSLRRRLAGNQDAQGQRNEDVRQREKREKNDAAVNGHAKKESHRHQQHAELEKAYPEIREQLAEQQAHGAHGGHEELLQGAAFLLPHDGKRGEKVRHVQEQNRHQAGQKEIGRTRIRIEKNFRAHLHREGGVAVG